MTRNFVLVCLAAFVAVGPLVARPKPTPLARLEYPPKRFPAVKPSPHALPIDISRLTSVGDFHLLQREDHLLGEPRCKGVAPRGQYRLGQGLLVYRLITGQRVVPVGTGVVRELHLLDNAKERVVIGFRAKVLKVSAEKETRFDPSELKADWEAGLGPGTVRYFTYPSNLTGMDFRDYERLTAGKIWVGMSRHQAKLVMGVPMNKHTKTTPWGWREAWKFPRSLDDHTVLLFANDQLRLWKNSWTERLAASDRWDWQKRPTRNPWVGREVGF